MTISTLEGILKTFCKNCGHYIDAHDPVEGMCGYCGCESYEVKTEKGKTDAVT